jgi:transcriptional regulator with XRE-family HTH domain
MQINGDLIRTMRYNRRISQEDLSCELDCPRSLISKIEGRKPHKNVTLYTAYKLAKYFNVTIESLILK